jgi:hypothetical protein
MTKHVLQIRCPCCQKPIEIDTRTGKARAMATKDTALDDLLDAQRREAERLDGLFDSVRDAGRSEAERREQMFRRAQEDAKGDRDKPRSPFDLD